MKLKLKKKENINTDDSVFKTDSVLKTEEKIFLGYDYSTNEMVYLVNEFKYPSNIQQGTMGINPNYHKLIKTNLMPQFIYKKVLEIEKRDVELLKLKKEVKNEKALNILKELDNLKFYLKNSNYINRSELIQILENIIIKNK